MKKQIERINPMAFSAIGQRSFAMLADAAG